ncbi:AraC family transcriptional regulator [Frigidibacter sp. ROC022]|uniref:AraC family transcriptional regulator n=1 Tax=Frigidibacter sp. ROC022 TaxID=2971796 RepID=UPI00215A9CBC|nr:AraC family transcriptional regulator [Frigidibacter sp. ROC022]MCR8724894.1 AraC family transcriptional regulator [Frigidibacter sp. ROC022]
MQGPYEQRLLRVIAHIHDDPSRDLSLDALAEVAALSRFHFHRIFHAMTGETVAETVRRIRMNRAAHWLVNEDWPIARIAARVGHPNTRSFARIFAEAFGCTPAAFRRRGAMTAPLAPKSKGRSRMFDVTIQTAPPRHVVGLAHRGPYITVGSSFETLTGILAARGMMGQVREMIGLYHDDPSVVAPEELRSHATFVLADGAAPPEGLEQIDLPGGRFAVLRFKGHYSGLHKAYECLYGDWLNGSGEEPRDAPAMEIYVNSPMDTAPDDLLTDICLPLK